MAKYACNTHTRLALQDLDTNAIDGKTYGLSTALTADEGALGRPNSPMSEKATKQKGKGKEKEKTPESDVNMEDWERGDSNANASGEEEVPTVVAPPHIQQAATTDAVRGKKVLKRDSDEPIVHPVPCVRRVGVACDHCKNDCKACRCVTHGCGIAKVWAATVTRAKAKATTGLSTVLDLIRRPKTTPLPTSPSAALEEDTEESEDRSEEEEGARL
ncbi:hypothetical protein F4604DRAFT_1935120 [Suillus subluteus]|nr:hypothetical protein F4604DRAFT_1935120 [Suillus subluteus]